MGIRLVRPALEYAEEVMEYKKEMREAGSEFDGCAGLEKTESFEEWADFENRLKKMYGEGYVPSEVFLAVREEDRRVVGIIDYRHPLSPFLLQYGGNIGYSVRPTERRKGYAKEMLRQMLTVCRKFGENRVLLCCDPKNSGSKRTITGSGGILENVVEDVPGIGHSGLIQRYWIELERN